MPPPTTIPPQLLRSPFLLAEAEALGVSRAVLGSARFRPLHHGVYVHRDLAITLPVRIAAARLVLPADATPTASTGLRVHGVEIGPLHPLRFVSRRRCQVRVPGVTVARSRSPLARVRVGDVEVVSAEHCVIEAARHLNLLELVVAGDWLLHRQITNALALEAAVTSSHAHGVRRARRALTYVSAGAESPRETYVRLLLVLSGLPEPECNSNIGNRYEWLARPDMVYAQYRLVVEYDGRHHDAAARRDDDVLRQEALEAAGWRVIVVRGWHLRQPRRVARGCTQRWLSVATTGQRPPSAPNGWTCSSASAADAPARGATCAQAWHPAGGQCHVYAHFVPDGALRRGRRRCGQRGRAGRGRRRP